VRSVDGRTGIEQQLNGSQIIPRDGNFERLTSKDAHGIHGGSFRKRAKLNDLPDQIEHVLSVAVSARHPNSIPMPGNVDIHIGRYGSSRRAELPASAPISGAQPRYRIPATLAYAITARTRVGSAPDHSRRARGSKHRTLDRAKLPP